MKAVLLTAHGGPEMLRYGDAPDPTAQQYQHCCQTVVDRQALFQKFGDYCKHIILTFTYRYR
jgi:hypothetical protein